MITKDWTQAETLVDGTILILDHHKDGVQATVMGRDNRPLVISFSEADLRRLSKALDDVKRLRMKRIVREDERVTFTPIGVEVIGNLIKSEAESNEPRA